MLRVRDLTKYYADAPILRDVSFSLGPGERAGIVGPNGSGKTTLLRIIAGREAADSGTVWLDPHWTLGYMRQGLPHEGVRTLGDVLDAGGAILTAQTALLEAGAVLSAALTDATALAAYDAAAATIEQAGGYEALDRVEQVLSGLGLDSVEPHQPIYTLSGGQKTRLALAALLLEQHSLLLLDEPTNHLDIPSRERFEEALAGFGGTVISVLHDRYAVARLATRVLELRAGVLREVAGV